MVKQVLFTILAASMAVPAHAALTSSNVPVHTHASVQQGGTVSGATLSNTTLSGTTTNSGTLSGGTVAPTTLTVPSGTTLSGATLSGATLVDSTVLSSSWLKPSSDTDVVRVRAFSPTQSASIFVVQNSAGSSTYFSIAAAGAATVTNALAVGSLSTGGAVSAGSFSTSGTVSSTKACASGFVRVGPNYCRYTGGIYNIFTATTTTACTQSPAITGVSDAAAIVLELKATVSSANAIAQRQSLSNIFHDGNTTCSLTSDYRKAGTQMREFAAVATGTIFHTSSAEYTVKSNATGRFWYTATIDGGANSSVVAVLAGYYD